MGGNCHPYFRLYARGWFSEVISWNRLSIHDLFSLSGVDNLLVPVNAFDNVCLLYAARLDCQAKAMDQGAGVLIVAGTHLLKLSRCPQSEP